MAENTIVTKKIKKKLKKVETNNCPITFSVANDSVNIDNELSSSIIFSGQPNGIITYNMESNQYSDIMILNLIPNILNNLQNGKEINLPIIFSDNNSHFIPINCKITKNSKGEFGVQIQFDNQIIDTNKQQRIKDKIINGFGSDDLNIEFKKIIINSGENKLSSMGNYNFGKNNCLIDTYYNLQYANDKISNDEMEKIKKLNTDEIRQKFFSDMLVNYFKKKAGGDSNRKLTKNDVVFINKLADSLFDDKDIQNIKDLFTTNKPIAEIIDIDKLKELKEEEQKDIEGTVKKNELTNELKIKKHLVGKKIIKLNDKKTTTLGCIEHMGYVDNYKRKTYATRFDSKGQVDAILDIRVRLKELKEIAKEELKKLGKLDNSIIEIMDCKWQPANNKNYNIQYFESIIDQIDRLARTTKKNTEIPGEGRDANKTKRNNINKQINLKKNPFKFVLQSDTRTPKEPITIGQAIVVLDELLKNNNNGFATIENIEEFLNVEAIQPKDIQQEVSELVAKEFQIRRLMMLDLKNEKSQEQEIVIMDESENSSISSSRCSDIKEVVDKEASKIKSSISTAKNNDLNL